MVVTFDPMANSSADAYSAFINFNRCITAIATAPAGTTSLSVPPYVANNTVDSLTNCIISIDANTEAGGWTTSASHNLPSNWLATAFTTNTAALSIKSDFYNTNSGKSAYPYLKFSIHPTGCYGGSVADPWSGQRMGVALQVNTANSWLQSSITMGCSSTSDWSDTNYPPNAGAAICNLQPLSYTMNDPVTVNTSIYAPPSLMAHNTQVLYRAAITENYVIIWEQPKASTYDNGYTGTIRDAIGWPTVGAIGHQTYGKLYYGGLRETQPWEDALSNNPPWVAMQIEHKLPNLGTSGSATVPFAHSAICAYMATYNDSGIATTSATRYLSADTFRYGAVNFTATVNTGSALTSTPWLMLYTSAINPSGPLTSATNLGLTAPTFYARTHGYTNTAGNMLYTPAVDPNTGVAVPPAVPIVPRRGATGSWTSGGALRGIYKSLELSPTMNKLYYSENQTFTVGTDVYKPVQFADTMYLVKWA